MVQPKSIEELQQLVRSGQRLHAVGGGTKSALHETGNRDVTVVSTTGFRGMLEYEPTEFTFTARAGTPLTEIAAALAEQGQYLPFDPPLTAAGATLGGTVAAGLSGSGRFAYGGLRDFLIGARLVNGLGNVVYGGGKVVKNAAGFDIPKLNVGALGQFGVLVELTFKVFPLPQTFFTLKADFASRAAALHTMTRLATLPLDLKCLDFEPPHTLWIRGGGREEALPARGQTICNIVGEAAGAIERIEDDDGYWDAVGQFAWRSDVERLAKVPITPRLIEPLEQQFTELQRSAAGLRRRYSVGGNLLWVAWPDELLTETFEDLLRDMQLSSLAVLGRWPQRWLGVPHENVFGQRLRMAFDPHGKLMPSSNVGTSSTIDN